PSATLPPRGKVASMVLLATSTTGTPATGYIIAVLAIMFGITFSLRALPFAILAKLRDSQFVNIMALWMPAGILALLAIALFYSTYSAPDTVLWKLLTAVGVTIASHLLLGRRTLVSIGLGTVSSFMLVNFFGVNVSHRTSSSLRSHYTKHQSAVEGSL